MPEETIDYTGKWRCTHWYPSNNDEQELHMSHDGEIEQVGNQLIFECQDDADHSYMFVRMSVDVETATGTWQETTTPHGEHKGATYGGAFQLLISDDRKIMDGLWVGMGQDNGTKRIYTGRWKFERI